MKKQKSQRSSDINKVNPPNLKGFVLKDEPLVKPPKQKKAQNKNLNFEDMQFETDEERSTNILGKLILTSQAQI